MLIQIIQIKGHFFITNIYNEMYVSLQLAPSLIWVELSLAFIVVSTQCSSSGFKPILFIFRVSTNCM